MLSAGIFSTESGQRLLHILLALGERGFRGLYDKCERNLAGDYYQLGLRRVHLWSAEVIREDVDHVKADCPDMEETWEACFVRYVEDRFRGKHRPTVRCPPVVDFVRRFLESLGQHESLATGDYFARRDTMLKRVACMDAARQALYALVTAENVRVELASEAGTAVSTSSSRRLADASRADLAAATTASAPAAPPSVVDDVRPHDSISQVSSVRRAAAVPSEVPSVRRDEYETPRRRTTTPSEASRDDYELPRRRTTAPSEVPSVRRATSEVSAPPPAAPPPPPPPRRPPSVVSRHDFAMEEEEEDDEAAATSRVTPENEVLVEHRPSRAIASSRDSQVSIGVKKVRSPRA